jgi:hypothetical protein
MAWDAASFVAGVVVGLALMWIAAVVATARGEERNDPGRWR